MEADVEFLENARGDKQPVSLERLCKKMYMVNLKLMGTLPTQGKGNLLKLMVGVK